MIALLFDLGRLAVAMPFAFPCRSNIIQSIAWRSAMRKIVSVMAVFLGCSYGAAHAADVTPLPAYDWTGAYIGVQAGYGWGETGYSYSGDGAENGTVDFSYDGFAGGGTAGFNWQHDQFVFGIEGDLSYSGISGDETAVPFAAPCGDEGCSADVNWFGTGRIRAGYAFDNVMPFVTGGFAVAGLEGDADIGACDNFTPDGHCSYDDAEWGWTAGGGIEWGISDNWSAKAEYLYVWLDGPDFSGGENPEFVSADDVDFSVVRVGVNYRFN